MLRVFLFLTLLVPAGIRAETLSGAVTGSDSRVVSSAIVTAMGTAKVPWTTANATTATNGTFTFSDLAPGPYRVCIQVPGGGYLNPCTWSTPISVTIASGKSITGLQLNIAVGSILKVRINDPTGISKTAPTTAPPVMMGVHTSAALFEPSVMRGKDAAGSDHEVTIPFDVPVKLFIQSNQLSLAKSDGTPVVAAAPITVTHSSSPGPPPPPVTVRITGGKP